MCGRFLSARPADEIRSLLRIVEDALPSFLMTHPGVSTPVWNIAPTTYARVVVTLDDVRVLTAMRWGLLPFWAKDEAIGNRLINARAETLAQKPAFRSALRSRRCVIPADGFYEWKANAPGRKRPFAILPSGALGTGSMFAFAGLWEHWSGPGGREVETFTIMTVDANDEIRPIHDRMPAILSAEGVDDWLGADQSSALDRLRAAPPGSVTLREVSTLVNSPKNDSEECLLPVDDAREGLFG